MKGRKVAGVISMVALLGVVTLWKPLFARPQVATQHSVTLTWTASTSPNVTYTVYRATAQAGPFTAIGTGIAGVTFVDTTATPGTTYYYEIDAVDSTSMADSGPSNEVNAKEPINPNPPTALTAVSK
jgi:cellulose 1,4-beta-cellobiosidase